MKYIVFMLKKKVLTPKNLHLYSPYLFFMEFVSVWYYGTWEIIPHLYANSGGHVIVMHQSFACFVGLEMIMNWLCIHNVDSGYYPEIHGSRSDCHSVRFNYVFIYIHVHVFLKIILYSSTWTIAYKFQVYTVLFS